MSAIKGLIRQEIMRMHQEAVLASYGNDTDWLRSRIGTCVDILDFIDSLPGEIPPYCTGFKGDPDPPGISDLEETDMALKDRLNLTVPPIPKPPTYGKGSVKAKYRIIKRDHPFQGLTRPFCVQKRFLGFLWWYDPLDDGMYSDGKFKTLGEAKQAIAELQQKERRIVIWEE